jgi:hypothetical protein
MPGRHAFAGEADVLIAFGSWKGFVFQGTKACPCAPVPVQSR